VDNFVFDLATEAAGHFDTPANAAMFYGDPEEHRQAMRDFFEQTPFVSLRLYSSEQRLLIEVWETGNHDLAAAAAAHRHDFPAWGDHHHNKIQVGDTLNIQVLTPLVSSGNRIFGYFEGIHQVSPATLAVIAHRVRGGQPALHSPQRPEGDRMRTSSPGAVFDDRPARQMDIPR